MENRLPDRVVDAAGKARIHIALNQAVTDMEIE
jgi:hypothetical protein